MRIYYFLSSLFYFLIQVFRKRHYSIVFYAPRHFNRGRGHENLFFKNLLLSCQKHDISFMYFEEPDLYNRSRSSKYAVPFDFLYYFTILLRRFIKGDSYIDIDRKIGFFIGSIFFRGITFDNYITISQSMMSLFYGINHLAKRFDLQHGTIHAEKDSYLIKGLVAANLLDNNVHLLLTGTSYKDILLKYEEGSYFYNHTQVIGSSIRAHDRLSSDVNRNVLVSLQFTSDHSELENQNIAYF